MATIGSLVITLEANIAKFSSDLGKAVTMAEAAMNKISRALGTVASGFELFGLGVGLTGIVSFVGNVINATASLQGLAMQTGLSVEQMSAIRVEAEHAGLAVDDAASMFNKLEKTAGAAVSGNVKARDSFAAIGISVQQLKDGLKDPASLLLLVANRLERYNDSGNKAVIMQALLSRSGAQAVEFMHNMTTDGFKAADATAAQAEQARKFQIILQDVSHWFKTVAQNIVIDFIPKIELAAVTMSTRFSDSFETIKYNYNTLLGELNKKTGFWAANFKTTLQMIFGILPLGQLFEALIPPKKGMDVMDKWILDLTLESNALTRRKALANYQMADLAPTKKGGEEINLPAEDKSREQLRLMDAALKAINEAIKAEDAAYKTGNARLDADYANGISSLASYSTAKVAMLADTYTKTQAYYDQEVATIRAMIPAMKDKIAIETANQKILDAQNQQLAARNKHDQDQIALNQKLVDDGKAFAKVLVDTDIAYANLTGNTELATKLQIKQRDAMTEARLQAAGLSDKLKELADVQSDELLRKTQTAAAGIKVAMLDYGKSLRDVAAQTQSMTTQMLGSMEDALVNFVQTGKLNFKSLIDSMIADIIRLQIRQSIMPGLSSWFGALFGAVIGAGGGGGGGGGGTGRIGRYASGGDVYGGRSILVGERGPELFTPAMSGHITPNGGAGPSIVYSPTIQVDSRSDRAAVQSEIAKSVRQGQADLTAMLKRYNPGLKV